VLGKRFSEKKFVWFEHGPVQSGTTVGCGVDQAHLHVIYDAPFSAEEFHQKALESGRLEWTPTLATSVYAQLNDKGSYLVAGSGSTAFFAQNVEQAGSQFFRKIVAGLTSQPDAWNYRTHPHLSQAEETIRTFRIK
jgi:ATP adenylyltransferase